MSDYRPSSTFAGNMMLAFMFLLSGAFSIAVVVGIGAMIDSCARPASKPPVEAVDEAPRRPPLAIPPQGYRRGRR